MRKALAVLVAFLMLFGVAGASHAAEAAEVAFWESVRDSKDPAELRAYLERYPNGTFTFLAQRRLAALESGSRPAAPAAPATPAPPPVAWTIPSPGDSWTYALREPKRTAGFKTGSNERTLVVTVAAASASEVVDQMTVDGAMPAQQAQHVRGPHLIVQGASVFSPYLQLLGNVPAAGSIGRVQIADPICNTGRYVCEASAKVVGKEIVRVRAGTFAASKIVVEHSGAAAFVGAAAARGGRTLTIWYAPEAKRAVKYASRNTFGVSPAIEDFELELVSYKVN
jgi:hypothetical protein